MNRIITLGLGKTQQLITQGYGGIIIRGTNRIITQGLGRNHLLLTQGYGNYVAATIDVTLTDTMGKYIRDILRTDTAFLGILNIAAADAKNKIFVTTVLDQHKGYTDPRVVVLPNYSDMSEIKDTRIYQGTEVFQIVIDIVNTDYEKVNNALDRIITLFNKRAHLFTEDDYVGHNIGEFFCTGKISIPNLDKENTITGELLISLDIGG